MELNELIPLYESHPTIKALSQVIGRDAPSSIHIEGLQASSVALALAALSRMLPQSRPFLILTDDEERAGYCYHDLKQIMGDSHALLYPSSYRRAIKYAQRDAADEILRTDVLGRLSRWHAGHEREPLLLVSHPAALAERVASREEVHDHTLVVKRGDMFDLTELAARLEGLGFCRRDYVYEPGEFAIRGSLLDVFSYSSEYPYRIDFFGDEVDSIRTFEVQSQLSHEQKEDIHIVPDVEKQGHSLVPFTDYLPADTVVVSPDIVLVTETIDRIYDEGFSRQAALEQQTLAAEAGLSPTGTSTPLDRDTLLADGTTIRRGLSGFLRLDIGSHAIGTPGAHLRMDISRQPLLHKNFALLNDTMARLHNDHYKIYLLSDSSKQTDRLRDILDGLSATDSGERRATPFSPVLRTLHEGFIDHTIRAAFLTDHQIFDRFHKYSLRSDRTRDTKMALSLRELMQFQPGDYVVHVDHGIGRFAGLVRMPGADGALQEVIKITFQHDDVVFVSIHALHKVSKYKGNDGGQPPRLSRLGTGSWEKMKERTKKKIKDIARDLIQLYSRRREEKGFAFSPDTFLQQELEASFTYEDTPDQLRVTREVKEDMERPRPMDRLVCGDVGFGKTEIAVRAAMKAAADGKQVAVLVPTTVLALQHYRTFAARLANFPVRVEYMSRARTAREIRAVTDGLADGSIDIVVGTHKLIGKSIRFKDLGLLIIDEEQKFGVAVKERLRSLKVNVDTLTMSATPIPRTLQFSLMGARDFSVIQTPPPNRYPIQTEIHTFSHEILAEAVSFEMSRNGQVYIVTNRVASLPNLANLLHKYVPDARVATGHGQMPPAELEQIVLGFINHDFDVLISTTIVENGIDIPNANTIIIDAAHTFGLSDLHQMRGRVGRSNRKAFCYLLAPPLPLLKDDARRRLQAIENFSDLGSGIHIAMQDLDIRGAGNLLGAEQSGFIADLGYETYQKILSEAVTELKNEEFAQLYADEIRQQVELSGDKFVDDCSVECDLRAYFPEDYVPGSTERMLLYRELDNLSTDQQIAAFRQRMLDRFGPMPPAGDELLRIVPLRRLGRKAGAERLILKKGRMTLHFVSHTESPFYRSKTFDRIIHYATTHFRRCELREDKGVRRMVVTGVDRVEEALRTLREMLEETQA